MFENCNHNGRARGNAGISEERACFDSQEHGL